MPEWIYPETWQVGDDLNADTLNRRVRDQNITLLRRPMLVARMTASQSLVQSTNQPLTWNTIDVDDDGMALDNTGGVYTDFYAQREGTYQVWLNVGMQGNGSGGGEWQTSIWLNGSTTRRWDLQSGTVTTSGKLWYHSQTGIVSVGQGETITARTFASAGTTNITIPGSSNGTPRLVIMWLGIT